MISSIGSSSSSMSMMFGTSAVGGQQPPPPPDQNVFQISDTDSDGLLSETELETLTEALEETTGSSIDTEEALATYDADEDGSLSGEELKGLMDSYGFAPPGMVDNETGNVMNMQPGQVSTESAISAYTQTSANNQISQLLDTLLSQTSSESVTGIDANV